MSAFLAETSAPFVKEIVDRPRGRGVHARRLDEILQSGALNGLDGTEMVQQRTLPGRADAGDLIEGVFRTVRACAWPGALPMAKRCASSRRRCTK